jgi:hypothetical protein
MEDIGRGDLLDHGIVAGPPMATEIGEEVWLPVSPVRGDAFRAVKVEVKERASVGGYEEKHAIEDWEGDAERLYDRSIDTDTDRSGGGDE